MKEKMTAEEFRRKYSKGGRKVQRVQAAPVRNDFTEQDELHFVVLYTWLSLNQILNLTKSHWSKYTRIKKKATAAAALFAGQHRVRVRPPVWIEMIWHLTAGMDADNAVFNQKFVLDGIVRAGVLPDDSPEYLPGPLLHRFVYGSRESSVQVYVRHIDEVNSNQVTI